MYYSTFTGIAIQCNSSPETVFKHSFKIYHGNLYIDKGEIKDFMHACLQAYTILSRTFTGDPLHNNYHVYNKSLYMTT